MDTYHFWGGISKFEDLELLRVVSFTICTLKMCPPNPSANFKDNPIGDFPGKA
jgi:hypothetical protein